LIGLGIGLYMLAARAQDRFEIPGGDAAVILPSISSSASRR